jgi:hypothetical protein
MSTGLPYSATGAVDGQLIIWDNSSLSVRSTCTHPEVLGLPLTVLALLHLQNDFFRHSCAQLVLCRQW